MLATTAVSAATLACAVKCRVHALPI